MGNHEYMLLEYARTGEDIYLNLLRQMQVETTLKSYNDSPPKRLSDLSFLPEDHLEFLNTLRPYYQTGEYLFVHAGLKPGVKLEEQPIETLVSIRDAFLTSEEKQDYTVVFGHTLFESPWVTPSKIGIDTGVIQGNSLTAVELPELRFYHA